MGLYTNLRFSIERTTQPPRVRRAVQKLWRNLCDYGPVYAADKVVAALAHPIYYHRTYVVYRANLTGMNVPPLRTSGLTFRLLREGESDLLAQIKKMEEWLDELIEPILKDGGNCIVALDQRKVAGFNLISYKRLHLPVVHFKRPLHPLEAFSEQVTVSRLYRGRGVGESLRREAFKLLKAQGIHRFYGGTDERNFGNLALCRKVGLDEIAILRYVKILWIKQTQLRRLHK